MQRGVGAALFEQFAVGALFDDVALFHKEDAVRVAYGGKAVRMVTDATPKVRKSMSINLFIESKKYSFSKRRFFASPLDRAGAHGVNYMHISVK